MPAVDQERHTEFGHNRVNLEFRRLLDKLGCAGFGWLRPEGIRRELETMAGTWQGEFERPPQGEYEEREPLS